MDSVKNKVAFGMAIEDEEMNEKIHGMPMPPGCLRVWVDGSINDNALVPVPVPGEIEKVHEAVGSQVAWPKDLITFPTSAVCTYLFLHIFCASFAKIYLCLYLFMMDYS